MRRLGFLLVFSTWVSSCSLLLDWSGEGVACSASAPCQPGFGCVQGVCRQGAQGAPLTQGYHPMPELGQARSQHTATLLPSGGVLVVGGAGAQYLKSAELFEPLTRTWSPAGEMSQARAYHVATTWVDGQVMVTGGISTASGSEPLRTVELYQPEIGTFTAAASFTAGRYLHSATALSDGRVLLAGGTPLSLPAGLATEILQADGGWSQGPGLNHPRFDHRAVRLPGNKVLVVGGAGAGFLNQVELFDPQSGQWNAAPSMAVGRAAFTLSVLPDGRVMVAGGVDADSRTYYPDVELYDPVTNTWSTATSMRSARALHAAAVLPDGRVLVVGGVDNVGLVRQTEIYDPATGDWTPAGMLPVARMNLTATALPDGNVLLVGGEDEGGPSPVVELYVP